MTSDGSFISDSSIILDSSFTILQYPIRRVRIKLSFLKHTDDSLRLYFITVYRRKRNFYIVYDATMFCYAKSTQILPIDKRIAVWANFCNNKTLYIVKYHEIDAKKYCYEYF